MSENNIRTYKLKKTNIVKKVTLEESNIQGAKGLSWIKPDSWTASEGSSMRLASFSVPFSEGVGDLSVIKLSGTGGGLESNVNRWRGQLDLSSLSINQIEKNISHMDGNLGEYGMIEIINKNDGRTFLCAIFPLDESTIFVKLSLNESGIKDVKFDFIKFCSSLNITK